MKIKSFLTKALTVLMSLCVISGTSVTAFAAELDEVEGENPTIVSELEVEPEEPEDPDTPVDPSWAHPPAFTFHTWNPGNNRSVDGRYLAYECTITSSDAPYISIITYVDGYAVRTDHISTDGNMHKIDWIDMGYSGNHSIQFVYSTPSYGQYATVDMVYYTWN